MSIEALENLERIRKLKPEAPDQAQINGTIRSAMTRIQDLQLEGLSREGRFLSAYGAAHSLAQAALRWHGYRSDNRYITFQCLQHTLGMEAVKWRLLSKCHDLRNLAEYEGELNLSSQLVDELIDITLELHETVALLGPVHE